MDAQTAAYYDRNASGLRSRYGLMDPDLQERFLRAVGPARKILDVGCGMGRDLAFLLRKGKDAYGVDASSGMIEQAKECLASQGLDASGRLFVSELPDLKIFPDAEFDAVLCSAVLMHLPEEHLFDAVYSLRRVLKPGGTLCVSVPASRNDVDPATRRDPDGRLFSDLPSAKLQLILERSGFSLTQAEESKDALGRPGVVWWNGEFRRADESSDRPLHLVESILSRDKKDATYKLALFRALAELAQTQTHLAAYLPEGKVKIPVRALAEKWLLYYWPIFESDPFIPQRTNEEEGARLGVAIRRPLRTLIEHFAQSGGLTGFYCAWKGGQLRPEAHRLCERALAQMQSTIHTMPAKHAGGGHYQVFQYDPIDKSLAMEISLWRELCLMGSWIRDATILRWAEQTEVFAKKTVKASQIIDLLLLSPDQGRNAADAQKHFRSLARRPCVWSLEPLPQNGFDVDHAMPFSYWRNNDLWNLFPTHPSINSRKSDKLPTYGQLQSSRDTVISYWRGLDEALGERFEREAQTLLGRDLFQKGKWETLLFSRFVEAFEVTAVQRGAARWEMPRAAAVGIPAEHSRAKPSPVRYAEPEEGLFILREQPEPRDFTATPDPLVIPFPEVGTGAFHTHLPLIGSLAAGTAFHGLQTGSLSDLEELDWVKVPSPLARPGRFVVRVAGRSMEPTFEIGDFLVFEYHRTPRQNRQIVIANFPEFGPDSPGTEAIKRITQDADHWILESDNPAHSSFRLSKSEVSHPILGTFVEKLDVPHAPSRHL